jgi:FtsP/CotA-like multicopper oxidase with cupredoxin domain
MVKLTSLLLLPAAIWALPTELSSRALIGDALGDLLGSGNTQDAAPSTSSASSVCAGNTATTRSAWCNYNIETDYYNTYPDTGVVRSYTFNIQNMTLSPDGVPRMVQAINGQIPGPLIEANWGDTIQVTVNNQVQHNGTSLHFHGVRQLNTNSQDGVSSITQCPVAPGNSITYTWKATQYGTSWYHSHFSLQAWDGVFGPIAIHGPASANYDEDLAPVIVQDWSHQTADTLYLSAQHEGDPPQMDNGLINGMNVFGSGGKRWETVFEAGKTYRLRFVNGAIDSFFSVSLDNHEMTVIATDFVPIEPYTTQAIHIGIGQRYDVLVTANQNATADAFWLRAVPDSFCSNNANPDNIMGIVRYTSSTMSTSISSSNTAEPTTSAFASSLLSNNCFGEEDSNIVPALRKTVSPSLSIITEDMEFKPNADGLQRWYLDGTTFYQPWETPTAMQILDGQTTFNQSQNVVMASGKDNWHYIVIETVETFAHPIHLHGHDFFVLAKGSGTYLTAAPISLLSNPPR